MATDTPTGPARVRHGYLSRTEREALAGLLDVIATALTQGIELPLPLRSAYAHACRALYAPREEFR